MNDSKFDNKNQQLICIARQLYDCNFTDSGIIEDLKKSHLFRALPKTPIAAILLAKLLKEDIQEIPSNMPELYSKYLELALGRWDIHKGLQSQKEFTALYVIVSDIAKYMIDNSLVEISCEEAKGFFKEYLDKRNLGIDTIELFKKITNRSDIFSVDERKMTLQFKHKTFAEYFYAYTLIKRQNILISEEIFDIYWANIFFFYIGLKRDCPDLLEKIINLKPQEEGYRFSKILNLGNFLLAAYSTPYEVISKGISTVYDEATKYYTDILKKNIDSPFAVLPEMHLLSVFRFMLKEYYSYDFFREGIEAALVAAEDENLPLEQKSLKLFLLDIAYTDVGGNSFFENLIDKYGSSLPIPIQLAIHHEAEYSKIKDVLIKKLERNLKKNLKGNKRLIEEIKPLYETPISKLIN